MALTPRINTSTLVEEFVSTPEKSTEWLVWAAGLILLSVLVYAPVLWPLVLDWWSDPDYSHGFFVPLFSGYILWRQRSRWAGLASQPANFGFLVMAGAIFLLLAGTLGAELFTARLSYVFLLAGMVLFLAGWKAFRAVSFPLSFLVFMIPVPEIIYNQITFPLQLLASRFATFLLELMHIPVLRDGNILVMSNYSLEVVEACSGVRSLMTLIALAVAYGYLIHARPWVCCAVTVLMIPNAVFSNAIRIMGACLIARRFGPNAAEGFLHEFSGWMVFLVALVFLLVGYRILEVIDRQSRRTVDA